VNTSVCLLRGINVSGQKKIRLQDLRELCESVGLGGAATYVQSGNVVGDTRDGNATSIAGIIEAAVRKKFGFEVPVIVRTREELAEVVDSNPFVTEDGFDPACLGVVFLVNEPAAAQVESIDAPGSTADRFVVVGRHIYLHCFNGFGRSKLSNNFFERKLRLSATTRNWKTVNALFDMLKER
jgi:uncharacterized protein (DUF1697 family)